METQCCYTKVFTGYRASISSNSLWDFVMVPCVARTPNSVPILEGIKQP